MDRYYYVYIMTTRKNTALYTGVTNDLKRRIYEHKEKLIEDFTKRYNINKLVYYEIFTNSIDAIKREKQLKGGSRKKKVELINGMNNGWVDLYNQI
jgi:putative endonuclease